MIKAVVDYHQLERLVIDGYKSIEHCDLKLGRLNILIGANGAGKSNFIGFFKMIAQMLDKQLQISVGKAGGPDALLHFGRKTTEKIHAELYFGNNGYNFTLEPTQDNRLMYSNENFWWNMKGEWDINSGHFESDVESQENKTKIYDFVVPVMRSWRIYHFHDTSESAKVKQVQGINDYAYLRGDAQNLAAFLYYLKLHGFENHYNRIVKTVQMVAPFFGDFYLRPTPNNKEKIELEWTEKNHDVPFKAHDLSDGTLRFICLATVLLQPKELMPSSILIDEPELGLHPYAISVLGSLMKSIPKEHQLIVSTQSVELVNEFDVEDLIIVDKQVDGSSFKRLKEKDLSEWLEEYALGELWKKNILGGRPSR